MVTIVGYTSKTNLKGKEYFALIIQGGIEFIKSKAYGTLYATAMKCYLPCSFDEQTCDSMVGDKLPGSIVKQSCDPFQYVDKTTGEQIQLNYRYVYSPDPVSPEKGVFEGAPERAIFD